MLSHIDFYNATEDELRKWANNLHNQWYIISKDKILSEEFIREMKDYIFWFQLYRSIITIDFIREYKHTLNWNFLSSFYPFTAKQLEQFKEYLDWWKVSTCQQLKKEFVQKYKFELSMKQLLRNKVCEFDDDYKNYIKSIAILKDE